MKVGTYVSSRALSLSFSSSSLDLNNYSKLMEDQDRTGQAETDTCLEPDLTPYIESQPVQIFLSPLVVLLSFISRFALVR